jgi:hypothetical protein
LNRQIPGQVLGTPGGSLAGASFVANRGVGEAGARGERKTAEILDQLASRPGGPSVLHDLNIPGPKYSANVDHVVVSGKAITIIDSKTWLGAFYWTIAGKTYRGLKRFATSVRGQAASYPAEKRTLPMAKSVYADYLGIPESSIRLGLVIWPTGNTALNLVFFRSPGSPKTVNGNLLTVTRAGSLFGRKPADPAVLVKLAKLLK